MDKNLVLKTLKTLRAKSTKKQFDQSVDIVINLQFLDLKKPEHKMDLFMQLPHPTGRKKKLAIILDAQLEAKAKPFFDTIILKSDFPNWQNKKKEQKKLAANHDYIVAQLELMAQIAGIFGKNIGARGKMPSPKAGAVVPGSIPTLEPLAKKLQSTIRLQTKNELSVKAQIGLESMKDEDLADNILAAYNTLLAKLPQDKNNIKYTAIKFTMSPMIKIVEEAVAKNKK
jgi:large subunit ribosomal protein L1